MQWLGVRFQGDEPALDKVHSHSPPKENCKLLLSIFYPESPEKGAHKSELVWQHTIIIIINTKCVTEFYYSVIDAGIMYYIFLFKDYKIICGKDSELLQF